MQAETADDLQLELPTESAATGATFGGGDPAPLHVASEPPRTDGVALRQQALTDTQFFQAGGCVTRPSPGAADYAAIAEPFVCLTNWWNGFFAQATAIQFRFRFSHAQGDGFHVQFRRSGVLESTHFVAAGSWFNIRRGWVVHCRSSCCGFLCLSSCSSCRAVASDQRLDLANASGDRFHVGGFFLNSTDDRSDTHPW